MGGIAGLAIRPIVSNLLPLKSMKHRVKNTHRDYVTPAPNSSFTGADARVAAIPSELVPITQADNTLTITDGKCSNHNDSKFIMKGYSYLRSLTIGDECFENARILELKAMSDLESIIIGKNSFPSSGNFTIENCPKLNTIRIGDSSFHDYESLQLRNLPSLKTIEMGDNCFSHASSFSLNGLLLDHS